MTSSHRPLSSKPSRMEQNAVLSVTTLNGLCVIAAGSVSGFNSGSGFVYCWDCLSTHIYCI